MGHALRVLGDFVGVEEAGESWLGSPSGGNLRGSLPSIRPRNSLSEADPLEWRIGDIFGRVVRFFRG